MLPHDQALIAQDVADLRQRAQLRVGVRAIDAAIRQALTAAADALHFYAQAEPPDDDGTFKKGFNQAWALARVAEGMDDATP